MRAVAGRNIKEIKAWFTYHSNALEVTREAIKVNKNYNNKIRAENTDKELDCVKNNYGKVIKKNMIAIVFNVFTLEYRINSAMHWLEEEYENYDIHKANIVSFINSEDKKIHWVESEESYFYENGNKYIMNNLENQEYKFYQLSLYEKWRNIPYLKYTEDPVVIVIRSNDDKRNREYIQSIEKIHKWIQFRNDLAHGNIDSITKKFVGNNKISTEEVIKCFDESAMAIFQLNFIIGYYDTKGKILENYELIRLMN